MSNFSDAVKKYLVLQQEHDEEKAKAEQLEEVLIPNARAAIKRAEHEAEEADGAAARALDSDARNRAKKAVTNAEDTHKTACEELQNLEDKKGNYKKWVSKNSKALQEAERHVWAIKRSELLSALELPVEALETIEKIAACSHAINGGGAVTYGEAVATKYGRVSGEKISDFKYQILSEIVEQNT